jgi:hypothetical protein
MTQVDGKWGTFEYLGTPASMGAGTAVPMGLGSSPAACGWGPDRLDVFAVGSDGDLLHTAWNGQDWSEFASLGAPAIGPARTQQQVPLSGSVAACRCGRDRIAVFLRGARGDLIVKWWDGTGWGEYISLGFPEVQSDLYPAVNIPRDRKWRRGPRHWSTVGQTRQPSGRGAGPGQGPSCRHDIGHAILEQHQPRRRPVAPANIAGRRPVVAGVELDQLHAELVEVAVAVGVRPLDLDPELVERQPGRS